MRKKLLLIIIILILSILLCNIQIVSAVENETVINKVYGNKNISYEDTDKNEEISVGDKVKIGTEGFYIAEVLENEINLLAEKKVDCNTYMQSDMATNIGYTGENYESSNISTHTKIMLTI